MANRSNIYALLLLAPILLVQNLCAQIVNANQAVILQGLRTANGYGSFNAAQFAPDGSLVLLLDQHDGVRVLKADPAGRTLIAQSQLGAIGDAGLSMAIDSLGNVYVAGTTTSGTLQGTSGVVFPSRADNSTNSFLAKYDTNLNLIFLTYLGAGRTVATGIAATSDAVFITGFTYSPTFPVTSAAFQQSTALGSSENGFIERFTADGTSLAYATYLGGANGNTAPAAIVTDSSDFAYIVGTTTSTGFPTVSALQPAMLTSTSGFLAKLTPAGDALSFSTYIAGSGVTGLDLDTSSNTLLLTGNVDSGRFPIDTVVTPIAATTYQTLLRIPVDGQSVSSSALLVPGGTSHVTVGPDQTAWVSGSLSTPLFPGLVGPDYPAGDSFLLHVTANDSVDQTMRFGGHVISSPGYASLTSSVAAVTISPDGLTVVIPGSLTATVSATLVASERFDLPVVQTPNPLLPNSLRDIITGMSICTTSQCAGSAAFLSEVSIASSQPAVSISADDLPNLTLRNLGSEEADGLTIVVNGFASSTNCGTVLLPSTLCTLALTGVGPGSVTVSGANGITASARLGSNTAATDTVVPNTDELDFGIVTSTSNPVSRTLTLTNLTNSPQTFTSSLDATPLSSPYTFSQSSADCTSMGTAGQLGISANGSCHITLSLTASNSSSNDGPIHAYWKLGGRDITLTGFSQDASVNLSASEVDFGTQSSGSIALPRYLYLSNNSDSAVAHTAVSLSVSSPFTVIDDCPESLPAHSVCPMKLTYSSPTSPSIDSQTITINGSSVLLTGETAVAPTTTSSTVNPGVSVSPTSLTFSTAVVVTGVSGTPQTLTIKNSGTSSAPVTIQSSPEFPFTSGCGASVPAGGSCIIVVAFAPGQPGTRQGVLSITTGSGYTPTVIALSGTGSPLLASNNGTLDLGQAYAGEPTVSWFKVQQSLTSISGTVSTAGFGVAFVEDTGYGHGTLPTTSFTQAAAGTCHNCWMGVQAQSTIVGSQSSTLTLSTALNGSQYALNLTANILPATGLVVTPSMQDFGAVPVNSTTDSFTLSLTNMLTTGSPVTVQSVVASGDYTVVANSNGGANCVGTLAAEATCFVQVTFSPTTTGERTGSLTYNTAVGPVSVSLTGYGTQATGLSLSPSTMSFSDVPGILATQRSVTITNAGTLTTTVSLLEVSDPSFATLSHCTTLSAGASCNVTVTFTPQTAPVSAALSFIGTEVVNGQTVTANYIIPLNGLYTSQDSGLEILPNVTDFGSTSEGNLGPTHVLTINNLTAKTLAISLQIPRNFTLTAADPCITLSAGASCQVGVAFEPSVAGELTGTVAAQGTPSDGSAGVQTLAYVLGYSAGAATLSIGGTNLVPNNPLNFGQVVSGQVNQKQLTLTNTGSTTMTVRRLTSESPFTSTSNCGGTLLAGSGCSVTLTYAPVDEILSGSTASAPRSDFGTLVVETDAASSPDVVNLTGFASPVTSASPASSAVIAAYQLSNESLTFSSTAVGDVSAVQTVSLTNTGTAIIHLFSLIPSNDFTATTTCVTVLPAASCSITVQFSPTNASTVALRSGTLEILTDAATSLEFISLVGTASAAPVTLSPSALDFGTVNKGSSGQLYVSVSNNSSAGVLLNTVSVSGDYSAGFGTCPANPLALAVGATCTLNVVFTPTTAGTRTGTLSLSTNATQVPLTVTLTGDAVQGNLQITPGTLVYGSTSISATRSLTLSLLNTGTSTIRSITTVLSGINSADFVVTSPCSTTQLAPNQGCTMTLTFTPSTLGAESAALTVTSSDPNSPAIIPLSGTGVAGGSFTLTTPGGGTVTVVSGSPAIYALTLTPRNGFTGSVALTCSPVLPGLYTTCSVLPSTLTMNGNVLTSNVTITTITSDAKRTLATLALLLFAPLPFLVRRRLRHGRSRLLTAALLQTGAWMCLTMCVSLTACGGGSAGGPKLLYTPAGTYQYMVTASSTSGAAVSSSVTLTLVVQ